MLGGSCWASLSESNPAFMLHRVTSPSVPSQTPVMDSGKQSPCNGVPSPSVTPQGHSFSTPPARRALIADQFQSVSRRRRGSGRSDMVAVTLRQVL